MFANLRLRLLALVRKIWVRASLYSVAGLGAAVFASAVGYLVPEHVATSLGAGSVEKVLTIMASSMLSVTIFALSTLVGSLASASNASPRAIRLVVEDTTAQNILATFLGVFLFSLVGIIALSTGAYGPGERFVLFLTTLVLLLVTIASLIRWIEHITRLGRLDDVLDRVEQAAVRAVAAHRAQPQYGASTWDPVAEPAPADAVALFAEGVGYVQHLDVARLSQALSSEQRVWVLSRPGTFVGPDRPLALVGSDGDAQCSDERLASLRRCWSVDPTRSYDQDPRFALGVLAEVASKALSAAVNDVGTAIRVLGRIVSVMSAWDEERSDADEGKRVVRDNVFLAPIATVDVLEDAFRPIARDGASTIEVGLALQVALGHVARLRARPDVLDGDLGRAAAHVAVDALARAQRAMDAPGDIQQLHAASASLLDRYGLATNG